MAGGPILPSSSYVGGASGNLSQSFYIAGTGTTPAQSAFEGIAVVASLGSNATAMLQFNLPESIPSGTFKLRTLGFTTDGSSHVAKITVSDGQTAVGSNLANTTLSAEAQITMTWATADTTQENKTSLTTSPTANNILTLQVVFNTTGWTVAQIAYFQFSLVWE